MIAIINYGLGNLHSVHKAVAYVGGEVVVTEDADTILQADKIILPGVGSFHDGMKGLQSRGLVPVRHAGVGSGDSGHGGQWATDLGQEPQTVQVGHADRS